MGGTRGGVIQKGPKNLIIHSDFCGFLTYLVSGRPPSNNTLKQLQHLCQNALDFPPLAPPMAACGRHRRGGQGEKILGILAKMLQLVESLLGRGAARHQIY